MPRSTRREGPAVSPGCNPDHDPVVIDTNILVSAFLQPLGPPAQILILALSGLIQLCISGNIYAEYEEVIRHAKFRHDEQTITGALGAIRIKAIWVKPADSVTACIDPDDNIFLESRQTISSPAT
jgi:putative PIN family toxin of toxin-antitoxin system